MSSISQLLAALDDSAWEALGSKGLLRRAGKELEKGIACAVIEDTPFALKVQVSEYEVTVPREGPARAKCSCGAPGCCHHVITAGLFCRRTVEASPANAPTETVEKGVPDVTSSATPVLDAILALDFSLLKRWCGAPAWRAGLRFLASGVSAEIQQEKTALVVRLNPAGVECRFLPGADLDGVIVSGGDTKSTRAYIAAAAVAIKARDGYAVPVEDSAEAVLGEEKGAPRSRSDVLQTARELLEFAVAAGLSHVGPASAERFATLATSAEGTNLPRLARSLKTVADELNLLATKHGRADTERALEAMASAYALTAALERNREKPAAHLVGEHRTGYIEVHSLTLNGITSFPWQARSGFRGITVLFWDDAQKRWNTWGEARSVTSDPRFDPLVALHSDSPWGANMGIQRLAASRVELTHARRNAVGRLSSTVACKARIVAPADPRTFDFGALEFSSWDALQRHMAATSAVGLRLADPTADWVVITPSRWNERFFDRVQQRLLWNVADAAGKPLWLVLSYSELTRHGVERLEQWEPPPSGGVRIVARLLRQTGEFAVEPFALIAAKGSDVPTLHLLVSPEPSKSPASKPARVPTPVEDDELESESASPAPVPAGNQWLRLTRDLLVRRAEVGATGKPAIAAELELLIERLANAGLPVLSRAISRLAPAAEDFSAALLRTAYLLHVHEECHAVS